MNKSIRFSAHARTQLTFRGTTEEEVVQSVKTAEWKNAELGKLECRMDFLYQKEWNGKRYETKQVRPIFADEETEIVIITVYVYYF